MKKRFESMGPGVKNTWTNGGSIKIVFIGVMFADVIILAVGVVLGAGRQRGTMKNEKNNIYRFLPTLQNA